MRSRFRATPPFWRYLDNANNRFDAPILTRLLMQPSVGSQIRHHQPQPLKYQITITPDDCPWNQHQMGQYGHRFSATQMAQCGPVRSEFSVELEQDLLGDIEPAFQNYANYHHDSTGAIIAVPATGNPNRCDPGRRWSLDCCLGGCQWCVLLSGTLKIK